MVKFRYSIINAFIYWAMASVLLALCFCQPVNSKSDVDKLIDQANFLYYHGDIDEAIKRFELILETEPDHYDAHMSLVNLYLKLRKTEEAIAYARKIVELKPQSEIAHLMLGNLLKAKGDTAGAIKEFEAAANLGNKKPDLCMNLGNLYARSNQLDKALNYYEKAGETKKFQLAAGIHVAVILFRLGKNEESLMRLAELKNKYGANAALLTTEGHLLAGMKRFDQAKIAYKSALKLNSQNPLVYKHLADVELREKNREGALHIYKDAIKVIPNSSFLSTQLGDIYYLLGDKDSSMRSFKKAIELDPENTSAYYALGKLSLEKKDILNASKNYQLGAEIEKDFDKKERMMRFSMNLRLKAGLEPRKLDRYQIGAHHLPQIVSPSNLRLFPISYADLVSVPNSKWLEMDEKISTFKPSQNPKRLLIPKLKAPRFR